MDEYKKMYAVLCGAIDEVIEPLWAIPEAHREVQKLQDALLTAEEIFISGENKGDNFEWQLNANEIVPVIFMQERKLL